LIFQDHYEFDESMKVLLLLEVQKQFRSQQSNVAVPLQVHANISPLILGVSQAIRGSKRNKVCSLGFCKVVASCSTS